MATTSRLNISSKFENNDIPTAEHFGQIIESFVHKDEDKADLQMVETGTDEQHYVTPALLRTGLQNIGIITGNSYMPKKEYFESSFSGTTLSLEKLPIQYSVKVYKNGQLLQEDQDYTVNYETAVITFSDPVSDRNIEVDYWFKNLSPNPTPGGGGSQPVDLTSFLHTSGNETKNGILTFNNTTAASTSGIALTNSGSGTASASLNVNVSGAGKGISLENSSNGTGVYLNSAAEATGDILQVAKNNVVKVKIEDDGVVTAPKYVTSGGTASQFVKGDGSLDSAVYAKDSEVLHTTGNESKDGALTLTHGSGEDVLTINKDDSANCLKLVQNSNSNATTSTWDTSTTNAGRKAISIQKQEQENAFITHEGDVTANSFTTISSMANLTDGLLTLTNGPSPEASEGKAKLYAKTDGTTDMYVMGSDGIEKKIGGEVDLSDYAKLASPALTGVPTAPTATAGTNDTQIATTTFVTSAISIADSGNIKSIGNQSGLTGLKTWENFSLEIANGAKFINSYSGSYYTSSSLVVENSSGSSGMYGVNKSTGSLLTLNSETDSTGPLITFYKNGTEKATINSVGEFKGTKFIVTGGTSTQFLKANGTVDSTQYLSAIGGPILSTLTHTVSNSMALNLINNSTSYNLPSIKITNQSNNIGINATGIIIDSSGVNNNNVGMMIESRTVAAGLRIRGINSGDTLFEGLDNTTQTFKLQKSGTVTSTSYNLFTLNTAPLSATATGTLGEIRITTAYIYVCIATNTWVRSSLTTW